MLQLLGTMQHASDGCMLAGFSCYQPGVLPAGAAVRAHMQATVTAAVAAAYGFYLTECRRQCWWKLSRQQESNVTTL